MNDLEQHLVARVLPHAYDARPGQAQPRFSEQQARHVLAFLARQMNQDRTRDLAWWQIPRWAPTGPRILASMLASGLLGAIVGWLAFMLAHVAELPFAHEFRHDAWTATGNPSLQGLAFGLGLGLPLGIWFGRGSPEPKQVKTWRAVRVPSVLTAGLVYGLVGASITVFVADLVTRLVANIITVSNQVGLLVIQFVGGVTVGFMAGLPLGLSSWQGKGQGSPRELVKIRSRDTVVVLVWGTVAGLAVGADEWFARRSVVAAIVVVLVAVPVVVLTTRLVGKTVAGLAVEFIDSGGSPQGPLQSWRNDRVFGYWVGLVWGVGFGLGFELGFMIWVSGYWKILAFVPEEVISAALPVGFAYGITSSATWSTALAWRQLRLSRRVPDVALMPFLEDARDRDILRTVGAVYQFRHATLQDQLAGRTPAS